MVLAWLHMDDVDEPGAEDGKGGGAGYGAVDKEGIVVDGAGGNHEGYEYEHTIQAV